MASRQPGEDQPIGVPTTDYSKGAGPNTGATLNPTSKLGEDRPIGIPTGDYGKSDAKPKAFDAQGAVGKQFTGRWASKHEPNNWGNLELRDEKSWLTDFCGSGITKAEEGVIGGTANKIGGPLAKDGFVGKQFTTEGSIGGTIQSAMGGSKKSD